MKYKIEIELDDLEIVDNIRIHLYKFFTHPNLPMRVTIKTFENGKPILNNIEIRRK